MKMDLKHHLKELYSPPSDQVTALEVPPFNFLMIDGKGNPNKARSWKQAMEALFGVSYAIKSMSKKSAEGLDYVVMPLEALWWTDDPAEFSLDQKDIWRWTAMIMQPPHITPAMVAQAVADTRRKKGDLPAFDRIRLERYDEGLSAQIMHLGPYATETATVERLHAWIAQRRYEYQGVGKHHEIYLGDPRRSVPEKLKTVIRQPIRPRAR